MSRLGDGLKNHQRQLALEQEERELAVRKALPKPLAEAPRTLAAKGHIDELTELAKASPEAETILLSVMGTLWASVELARKSVALDEARRHAEAKEGEAGEG